MCIDNKLPNISVFVAGGCSLFLSIDIAVNIDITIDIDIPVHRGWTSSVGKALECRMGGNGFDSRRRNSTRGLKITGSNDHA